VLAEHGRGGFGVTYRARREEDGAEVIVKVLRLDRLDDWKAHELFEREVAVLRVLSHPGVPAWLDDFLLGEPDRPQALVLVQELIPGRSLRELMGRGGGLSPELMRSWFEQILAVLEYLHGRSPPVIHRDVTPKNIIVGPDGRAALVDFGSVQAALQSGHSVASTAAGTFGYAPLEQFVGRAGPASDLYGLGMSYLAVASGREPSEMPLDGVRVDVRALLAGDERLISLLEAMTAADPRHRLSSAAVARQRLAGAPAVALTAPPLREGRVAEGEGYLMLVSERLRAEGFMVQRGGELAGIPLALIAWRPRGVRYACATHVYVALGEQLPGGGEGPLPPEAVRPFVAAARAAHPRSWQPSTWLGGTPIVVPIVIATRGVAAPFKEGLLPGGRDGPLVMPVVTDLAEGHAHQLVGSGPLGGNGATALAYVGWLGTPRLRDKPVAMARASWMRVATGLAAGLVGLIVLALGLVTTRPHGTFYLTYAADPVARTVAVKALFRERFLLGTEVQTLAPGRGPLASGTLPADAYLCELDRNRLGYWRLLGGGMVGYFRAALDGSSAVEVVRAPASARWSCAVLGDRVIYPMPDPIGAGEFLWIKRGPAPPEHVPGCLRGDRDPAWFPDGRALVVAQGPRLGERLYRVDLETGARQPLLEDSDADSEGGQVRPSVSPDGKRVAFYRAVRRSFGDIDRRGTGQVYDLELAEKGKARLLLQDVCFAVAPGWLRPDELVFGKWVDDRCALFAYDLPTEQALLIARDY
jgi:hypothetical protein